MYLLDTNILTTYLLGDEHIVQTLDAHRHQGLFTSSINIWEVINGYNRSILETRGNYLKGKPNNLLRSFESLSKAISILNGIPSKPYDSVAEQFFLSLPKKYHETEKSTDGMIASVAFVNGLILVTRNVKDFKEIDDLDIDVW